MIRDFSDPGFRLFMSMFRSFKTGMPVLALAVGVALCAVPASPAHAQPLADAGQLGMSLAELQAAFPSLQRMARAVIAPHGLRGQWRLTDTRVAGLPFETTFFFQGQRVQRIEQLHVDDTPSCAQQNGFAAVVSATGLQYGGGATGFTTQGVDAFGTSGDADVSAHLQVAAGSCAIRIVYKPMALRDASTL